MFFVVGWCARGAKVIGFSRVLLFRVGIEKRGGNLSFGSFPRFSSFCVERTTGLEPAAFTLGG